MTDPHSTPNPENSLAFAQEADRGELAEALAILREHGVDFERVADGVTERVLSALRCALANIITPGAKSTAALEADTVALVIGFPGMGSITAIARRHGISKAAMSKRCVRAADEMGLPPSCYMKSTAARQTYRRTNGRAKGL